LHTVTNGDGIYSFPSLQTGPFVISITHSGFRTAKDHLTLYVAQTAQIDLTLSVGSPDETVTLKFEGLRDRSLGSEDSRSEDSLSMV
jgi:hypothetical protein